MTLLREGLETHLHTGRHCEQGTARLFWVAGCWLALLITHWLLHWHSMQQGVAVVAGLPKRCLEKAGKAMQQQWRSAWEAVQRSVE